MNENTCLAPDCDTPRRARGLCDSHYGAAKRGGFLDAVALPSSRQRTQLDPADAPETIDCPTHGPGSRARIRVWKTGVAYVACRACDRGPRAPRPYKPSARDAARKRRWSEENRLRVKYGISNEDYASMLEAQGAVCAICEQPQERKLFVDHCHDTGTVRGLLCHSCNVGLGWFRDDPKRLVAAVAYLHSSAASPALGA